MQPRRPPHTGDDPILDHALKLEAFSLPLIPIRLHVIASSSIPAALSRHSIRHRPAQPELRTAIFQSKNVPSPCVRTMFISSPPHTGHESGPCEPALGHSARFAFASTLIGR